MPGAVHPLVEELLEGLPAHVLERPHEVVRLDDAAAVPFEVEPHALPEQRRRRARAGACAARARLSRRGAGRTDRSAPRSRGTRWGAGSGPFASPRYASSRRARRTRTRRSPRRVLALDVLEVRREALVQPAVRPVAARDEVAEPLVRELVRDEVVARDVEARALVEQHVLVQRRRRRVLHPAEDEVAHDDLRVAAPRERRRP